VTVYGAPCPIRILRRTVTLDAGLTPVTVLTDVVTVQGGYRFVRGVETEHDDHLGTSVQGHVTLPVETDVREGDVVELLVGATPLRYRVAALLPTPLTMRLRIDRDVA
jgi:hypothetical protein